jgi:23S rRNA pseudouridine2457 synthase
MPKTYWVQVEGTASEEALQHLRDGVELNDGLTLPAHVMLLDGEPPLLWPRTPPVRIRLTVPTSWLELRITEGRNRQARSSSCRVQASTLCALADSRRLCRCGA